jgi:hypothetical protein
MPPFPQSKFRSLKHHPSLLFNCIPPYTLASLLLTSKLEFHTFENSQFVSYCFSFYNSSVLTFPVIRHDPKQNRKLYFETKDPHELDLFKAMLHPSIALKSDTSSAWTRSIHAHSLEFLSQGATISAFLTFIHNLTTTA